MARNSSGKQWHLWAFVGFLLLSFGARFLFLGSINYGPGHDASASVLNYAGTWYEEGYRHLHGAMYDQPSAVDFALLNSRSVYTTNYSFFVVPIFVLAKITGEFPQPWMINFWNFVLHAATAFLMGSLAYGFSSELKEKYRKWAFAGASFTCLLTIQYLYNFSAVYWTDQLLLPLIAGILLCEQKIDAGEKFPRLISFQQGLVLLAVLSGWYGLFFSVFLLGHILAKRNWKRVLHLLIPLAMGVAILASYFARVVAWEYFQGYIRLAFDFSPPQYGITRSEMFKNIFVGMLGFYCLFFLGAFAVADQLHKKKIMSFKYIVLLFLAPLVYTFLFAATTYLSEYSVLKFFLPVFIFLGGVFPVKLWVMSKKNTALKSLCFLPAVFTVIFTGVQYSDRLNANKIGVADIETFQWIKSIVQPEQVIFSNHLVSNYAPPQGPYILRKNIWNLPNSDTFLKWGNIFKDTLDYPMLWLEVKTPHTEECIVIYKAMGATSVAERDNVQAFMFPNIRDFREASIAHKLDKCL